MVRPTILPGEMRDVQNKKARVSTSLLETDGLNQAQIRPKDLETLQVNMLVGNLISVPLHLVPFLCEMNEIACTNT